MKKINFEESLKRLEEITEQMESRDITLDDSLKLFEEGIKLSRYCEAKLTEAEEKLEIVKSAEIEAFAEDEEEYGNKEKKKKKSKKKESPEEEDNASSVPDDKKTPFLF